MAVKDPLRLHLEIHGRVQGVWFRASTREEALGMGLSGWVRNRANGNVEVTVEGERSAVDRLVAWCRTGPRGASVSKINIREEPYVGEFDTFQVRY
ncbi:MAG: acylphosphatase [bacterium]|nr:acylphosphatase [bacterium]